jgi:NADH dehydrogenase
MTKHICILGGGFAGLYTALDLAKLAEVKSGAVTVTLVEPKDNFLFTPLLYELLTGELQRWQIAPSYQKLLHRTPIKFCQDKAMTIDLINRQVKLANYPDLNYDYLVLAVGTENRFAEIKGLQEYALTFRSLEDYEQLNQKLHLLETSGRQKIRVAVIGGGANGVELACKLGDRLANKGQIYLIQRSNRLLNGFPLGLVKSAHKSLGERGVQIYYDTQLEEIAATEISLSKNQQPINLPTDIVIWATGNQCLSFLQNLPCAKTPNGKLKSLPTLQLREFPEVFALGDLAHIPQGKSNHAPAKAQSAYQQASCAARNINALIQKKTPSKFRYFHLGDMMTLGKKSAIVSSYGINLTGYGADVIRRLVYIQRLPTTRHRLQVFKNWFGTSLRKRLKLKLPTSKVKGVVSK